MSAEHRRAPCIDSEQPVARLWTLQCRPEGLDLHLAFPARAANGGNDSHLQEAALRVLQTLLDAEPSCSTRSRQVHQNLQRIHAGLVTRNYCADGRLAA